MDMPRKGYTSLTLKDHAARIIQMGGAVHPRGQSGYVEDLVTFSRDKKNEEAFITLVKRNNKGDQ